MLPQEMLLDNVLIIWKSACVTRGARRLWQSLVFCCGRCCMMCYNEKLLILCRFYSVLWINMGEGEAEVKRFTQHLKSGRDGLNLPSLPGTRS